MGKENEGNLQKIGELFDECIRKAREIDPEISVLYALTSESARHVHAGRILIGESAAMALLAALLTAVQQVPEVGNAVLTDMVGDVLDHLSEEGEEEPKGNILDQWEGARRIADRAARAIHRINPNFEAAVTVDSGRLDKSMSVSTTEDAAIIVEMATCLLDEARVRNELSSDVMDRFIAQIRRALHASEVADQQLKDTPLS